MTTKILITGGAGFIGHHLVSHLLRTTDCRLVLLDRLDLSGSLNRLSEVIPVKESGRCQFIWHDLKAPISSQLVGQIGPHISAIVHLAASTHVDRSIADPMGFVLDNVVGTCNLLEYARRVEPKVVINFSTDEVFGPARSKDQSGYAVDYSQPSTFSSYKEWDRYRSTNPYAATKAGAEELGLAYHNTFNLPVVTIHCMNVFGERQYREKYIPSTIRKVNDGETVTVHADRYKTVSGSRHYIHALDVAGAVQYLLLHGKAGDKYNVVGKEEVSNLELAKNIASIVGKPLKYELVDYHSSRPGHDLRYALDGTKLALMGWSPKLAFKSALEQTVRWYLENPRWL